MILSKKRITKALIRLRGCAGWSAPVFSQATEDVAAKIIIQNFIQIEASGEHVTHQNEKSQISSKLFEKSHKLFQLHIQINQSYHMASGHAMQKNR